MSLPVCVTCLRPFKVPHDCDPLALRSQLFEAVFSNLRLAAIRSRARRRAGLCQDCAQMSEPGRSRCAACRERHRMRWHRRQV